MRRRPRSRWEVKTRRNHGGGFRVVVQCWTCWRFVGDWDPTKDDMDVFLGLKGEAEEMASTLNALDV